MPNHTEGDFQHFDIVEVTEEDFMQPKQNIGKRYVLISRFSTESGEYLSVTNERGVSWPLSPRSVKNVGHIDLANKTMEENVNAGNK